MPIYQYKCTDCDHGLEALQKMSDPKLVDCPACDAPALKKQVTAAAFKLKGTGWYETDFKNSGKKPEPVAKKGDNSNKKANAGADSKPANSSDSKSESASAVKSSASAAE